MAIAIKEKRQIEKAVAKAKTVKPRVKVLGYCKFEVSGSRGDSYQVSFSKGSEGGIEGDCSCTAGKKNKSVCYHIAAVAGIAKQQVMKRASARSTQATATNEPDTKLYDLSCPNCGQDFSSNVDCFFCPECEQAARVAKDESDLFGGSY